ncbi:exosome complex exonuclease-like protein Rrp6 [Delitschia confertaspora ATCC 74209]|uniref:Exosome complex exonuclease-like protein Rrp6 n=1 Tax=Delitschia confertaspora ATCC 74209 TaxID=1513339 RepID=A0A9P4JDP9_9PLEO|nr:exosome complex exonuclease-like protein Rrp6 [Delitschia confertaspora ATCC 74209]
MDPAADFKSLQETIQTALIATTRTATSISAGDIPFQRTLDPQLASTLDTQNARLLRLTERLLESVATNSHSTTPKLPDIESIDNNWRDVVDVLDSLLEKADTSLDEFTGAVKRMTPAEEQGAAASKAIVYPKHLPKPQLSFEHVPTNNETGGFKPLLTSKPHAKVPLEEGLKTYIDASGSEQYPHPYQVEIQSYKYPASLYEKTEPIQYLPFESTTATFVDTPEALAAMLAELKTAKEIAIDLEHHDNRSYIGIVSLMQISTRNKDWIIDTLKPWRRRLECLNEVFADPSILKVLHGAYMDIVWLQRDLGLYIVGLFDTFHAARTLGYPGASLAYLLKRFIDFDAQKQYQMADWRIRPLSPELFDYARADTHFLLYVFDNMRNELIDRSTFSNPDEDRIQTVFEKSMETALQRYEHPIYDAKLGLGPVGWYRLLSRTPVTYSPEQFSVFKAVHEWRDKIARLEDESVLFIMPNHAIFTIARTLPEDKTSIFAAIHNVSPIVRMRADELVNVISTAKAAGKDGPQLNDELLKIECIRKAFRRQDAAVITNNNTVSETPVLENIQSNPLTITVETPLLRAKSSQFWGSLLSEDMRQRIKSFTSNISLALPLPPLTAEIFSDATGSTLEDQTPKVEDTPAMQEEALAEEVQDEVFTVKQKGGSRKRTADGVTKEPAHSFSKLNISNSGATEEFNDDQIMLGKDDAPLSKADKNARRKEKKRKAAQETSGEGLNYDDTVEDEAPFDYANAPSVLKAQQPEKGSGRHGKTDRKKKKPQGFNPYAKMADVPKGLARSQRESAGRSKTFTS